MIQTIITFRNPTELACFLAAFHHVHRQLAVAVPLVTGTFVIMGPTFSLVEALTAIAFVCTLPRYKEREEKGGRKERGNSCERSYKRYTIDYYIAWLRVCPFFTTLVGRGRQLSPGTMVVNDILLIDPNDISHVCLPSATSTATNATNTAMRNRAAAALARHQGNPRRACCFVIAR